MVMSRRQRLSGDGNDVLHGLHDGEGRGAADLVHRHQRAANTILAHHVRLRSKAIADVRDIAHVDGGAVYGFHRQIVQLSNGLRRAVHLDLIFQRADLGRARRRNQVLRVESADDVVRRQSIGLQAGNIEIDLDLANLAAIGIGHGCAVHGRQLRAQEILAQVEELLLRQGLAAESKLHDRRGGRRVT